MVSAGGAEDNSRPDLVEPGAEEGRTAFCLLAVMSEEAKSTGVAVAVAVDVAAVAVDIAAVAVGIAVEAAAAGDVAEEWKLLIIISLDIPLTH